jgi:phosphatidylglycerophosphate synthase
VAIMGLHAHPFPRLGPANRITFFRVALLALVAAFIGEGDTPRFAAAAVIIAVLAEGLDGADGWLARKTGMASRFGARFDMEIDALLIMVLSVLVWHHGKAGVWVLAGGLMRYAFVAAAWVLPWMARPLKPTRRAQTIAVTHEVGLDVALAPIIPMPWSALAALVTLLTLAWSFTVDVRRLWRNEGAG